MKPYERRTYKHISGPRELDWQQKAACGGALLDPDVDPHLETSFFPDPGRPSKQTELRREAVRTRFCHQCPVQKECLDFGLRHHYNGVWGGEMLSSNGKIMSNFAYHHSKKRKDKAA